MQKLKKFTTAVSGTLIIFSATTSIADEVVTHQSGDMCIISSEIPLEGAKYKKKDKKTETKLCSYHMNSSTRPVVEVGQIDVALCPKLFSSSPAVELFKIPSNVDKQNLQKYKCNWSVGDKTRGFKKLAKYKYDIAGQSISSMMGYYHISRALGITSVPASVYKTLNKTTHKEVALRGKKNNNKQDSSLAKYWRHIYSAFDGKIDRRFVTANGSYSFGALSENPRGEQKYYEDFWPGAAQKKGITAFKNTKTYKNLGRKEHVSKFISANFEDRNLQKLRAMKDASDMIILDSIFGQGDRFGNIHSYHTFLTPEEDGSLKKIDLADIEKMLEMDGMAKEIDSFKRAKKLPNDWKSQINKRNQRLVLISKNFLSRLGYRFAYTQEIYLKDNDAGLVNKVNPFQERRMMEGVYHVNQGTYEQVLKLHKMVQNGGLDTFLTENLFMDSTEKERFKEGLDYVTRDLINKEKSGKLFLDLSIKEHFTNFPDKSSGVYNTEVIKSGVRVRTGRILTEGLSNKSLLLSDSGVALQFNVGDLLSTMAVTKIIDGTSFTKVKVINSRALAPGTEVYIWSAAIL